MSDKINHTELILERMKHEAEIAKLQNENGKLKGLLKKAVEDIRKILASECAFECDFCIYEKDDNSMCANPNNGSGSWCCENCKWKHADEAVNLIGGNKNE